MANDRQQIYASEITEGLLNNDLWNLFDSRSISYLKSSIQLRFITSKTSIISRILRHAVVDLLAHITCEPHDYIENDTTVIGTEHRLYHSRLYTEKMTESEIQSVELNEANDEEISVEISSLAPTVFYKLREDIGIKNVDFFQSFAQEALKDFTNPGRSGSLMYKTSDDLYILKTLHEYEAHLLMEILSGYHLQITQRPTIFNRFVGLYSLRFRTLITPIQIYIVVMVNVFTPSLNITEIFDLKGSTLHRKSEGPLSIDKLLRLKDLDFLSLYPNGILIPSKIYQQLRKVITNDARVLRKLNITDFSLILGIRHIDLSQYDLMRRRPSAGVSALCHTNYTIALLFSNAAISTDSTSVDQDNITNTSMTCTKPMEILYENIDKDFFYNNDAIARASLPIPGIVNKERHRVYIYLAIIDMLQAYDTRKALEHRLKQLTNPNFQIEGSVIESEEYEKRFLNFLFQSVFIDAGDDFPWDTTNDQSVKDYVNTKSDDVHSNDTEEKSLNRIINIRL